MKGTDTGIRMTLVDANEWTGTSDGKLYRHESWLISGGEVDPAWRRGEAERAAGWEPSSRFSLYIVDGEIDPRLASYGGVVWPTAWPELFCANRPPNGRAFVEITDQGLMFRSAALDGASDMYADARLS